MKTVTTLMIITTLFCTGLLGAYASDRPQRVMNSATPDPSAYPNPAALMTPAILSIIPSQAEPGSKVQIFGSSFGDQSSIVLGSIEIPARIIDGKQAEFTIPQHLDPGLYALFLKRSDGVTSRAYNFSVLPSRPVLNGLSPETISSCSQGSEREVTAIGQNFIETSQLVFDGSVLKSRFVSDEAVSFKVPQVQGGLHQVLIRNSPDNASVAMGLMIETKPEIYQIMIGTQYVNYYELIIIGKNFHQNSSIYVDGQKLGGTVQDIGVREKLDYIDCTKLIYERYPYSQVDKDFRIMVMNPGGESSQTVGVSAP